MHDDTKVQLITTVMATLIIIYLIVGGHGCVERRDNIIADCIASERTMQECALLKCQYSSDDVYCEAAFGEEN